MRIMGGFNAPIKCVKDIEHWLGQWKLGHKDVINTVIEECPNAIIPCKPDESGQFKIPRDIPAPYLHETLKKKHPKFYRRKKLPRGNGSIGGCRGQGGFACESEVLQKSNENPEFKRYLCQKLGIPPQLTHFEDNTNSRRVSRRLRDNPDKELSFDNNNGQTIADMFAIYNGKKYPISVKSTDLTTFINAGTKKCLKESEIRSGKIKDSMGKTVLSKLGIDNEAFCAIFNNYLSRKDHTPESASLLKASNQSHNSSSTDPETLSSMKKFVDECMGEGDYMVIHKIGGQYRIHKKRKCGEPLSVEWQYGGSNGVSKRMNIIILTEKMKYIVNIRNKQGGTYPTHIMCDFKER